MATLVTEVTSTDADLAITVRKVVDWFCDAQSAFRLEYLDLPTAVRNAATVRERDGLGLYAPDVFESMRASKRDMRGTHDRLIAFTTLRLDGQEFGNLFSSVEEDASGQFTGLAVVTTIDVEQLTDGLPLEGYLFQQLVSINLRWVVGRAMLHDTPPNDCLFHKRINKRLVVLSVKEMRLCDRCREMARSLDDKQWRSLKEIMHDVSQSMSADDPRLQMDNLLARRAHPKYHPFSWRNPDKTIVEDVIDNWRRLRRGRAKYTVAIILAIGGVAVIDPPWWEQMLELLLGIPAGAQPSVFQQAIGFLVILLAFLLLFVNRPPKTEC